MKRDFFIYGTIVSHDWYKQWETITGLNFQSMLDRIVDGEENITGVFDNRGQGYLIIGKIFETINSNLPIIVPEIGDVEKYIIENTIKHRFDLSTEFNFYFIKNYDGCKEL